MSEVRQNTETLKYIFDEQKAAEKLHPVFFLLMVAVFLI